MAAATTTTIEVCTDRMYEPAEAVKDFANLISTFRPEENFLGIQLEINRHTFSLES